MSIGESQVRTWNDVFAAFDETRVFWLVTLLALEFITGVALALKEDRFDWSRTTDIARKGVFMLVAWGAAFVYSDAVGAAVYGLIVVTASGSVAQNIAALLGVSAEGLLGQLINKGPGSGAGREGG